MLYHRCSYSYPSCRSWQVERLKYFEDDLLTDICSQLFNHRNCIRLGVFSRRRSRDTILLSFTRWRTSFYRVERENYGLRSRGRFIGKSAMCLSRGGAIQIRYWRRLHEEPRMRAAIDRSRYEKTWRKAKVIAASWPV